MEITINIKISTLLGIKKEFVTRGVDAPLFTKDTKKGV